MKKRTISENQADNFSEEAKISCPVHLTLSVLSGKWKLKLLWHLRTGSKRFGELNQAIPAITQTMLSQHLKALEEDGIITRKMYMEIPPKVEYFLSPLGQSLIPIIATMERWGITYSKNVKGKEHGNCLWSEQV